MGMVYKWTFEQPPAFCSPLRPTFSGASLLALNGMMLSVRTQCRQMLSCFATVSKRHSSGFSLADICALGLAYRPDPRHAYGRRRMVIVQ